MAKLSPLYNEVTLDDSGNPASGWKVYTYVAGSSTPADTYTSEAEDVPQQNPVILNARGEPDSPIWLTEGVSYKFVLTDADDVVKRTVDDVTGIGDNSITLDQWVVGASPTYVSASAFTVPGDQTSAFHANRRFKAIVTAGTVYGKIASSSYDGSSLTTVNTENDSGSLDAGLSAISLGLITATNSSLPLPVTPNTYDRRNASGIPEAKTPQQVADELEALVSTIPRTPIGGYEFVQLDITGAEEPDPDYFIRLKSGLADEGEYNEGKLTSESVSGSDPTITATAVIDDENSPMDGQTVHLVEDERRFLRAGSPGTLQDSQNLAHTHTASQVSAQGGDSGGTYSGPFATAATSSSGGTEARPRNIGVAVYMRIK